MIPVPVLKRLRQESKTTVLDFIFSFFGALPQAESISLENKGQELGVRRLLTRLLKNYKLQITNYELRVASSDFATL